MESGTCRPPSAQHHDKHKKYNTEARNLEMRKKSVSLGQSYPWATFSLFILFYFFFFSSPLSTRIIFLSLHGISLVPFYIFGPFSP